MIDDINAQFEEYQKQLAKREMHIKYNTQIEVSDEFFNLIEDVCNIKIN